MNFSSANTLGERVINECELISRSKTIEKIYGDFLHVDNLLKTPIEKRDKFNTLLCKNGPGVMYLDIPFYSVKKGLLMNTDYELRILFGSGGTDEINGYLLVDYTLTDSPPRFPFFEKIRQVQRLSALVASSNQVTMDVYLTGPVYELYFTVTDSNGNLIDAIRNVKFSIGSNERFNLNGDYLRLVEPMKRHGRIATEPVYVYSLCINPDDIEIASGQSNFPERQRFVIDLYENNQDYCVNIFAQSHNMYYSTESNVLPVFESTEMLIATETEPSTNYTQIPIKTSYTNYSNASAIYYIGSYEIENVNIKTNIPKYTITQNEIILSDIDSVEGSYYADVTYYSKGFSNLTCKYLIQGALSSVKNILSGLILPTTVKSVSCGGYHTAIVTTTNDLFTFGNNGSGQLGLGNRDDKNTPQKVTFFNSNVASVSCGGYHTAVVTTTNDLFTFGANGGGGLGLGYNTDKSTPQRVTFFNSNVASVSCGENHTAVVGTTSNLFTFGANGYGQLGIGHNTNRNTPQKVTFFNSNVASVSCGANHTAVVTNTNNLFTFGWNNSGQLGIGNNTNRNTPQKVTFFNADVASVSCGADHTAVVTNTNDLFTFGVNGYGQLGLGDNTNRNTPEQVTFFESTVASVSCGGAHTAVVGTTSNLFTFGWNNSGQLGLGDNNDRNTPEQVTFFNSDVTTVSCGANHTAVVTNTNNLFTFGWNNSGQLGLNNNTTQNAPQPVTFFNSNVAYISGLDGGQKYYYATINPSEYIQYGSNTSIVTNSNGYVTSNTLSYINEYRDVFVPISIKPGKTNVYFYNSDGTKQSTQVFSNSRCLVKYDKNFFIKYYVSTDDGYVRRYTSYYNTDVFTIDLLGKSPRYDFSLPSLKLPSFATYACSSIVTVKNNIYSYMNYITNSSCKIDRVKIDSFYNTYVSGTTLDTLPLMITNSDGTITTITYGSGSIRSFLLKFDSNGMLKFYKIMTNTFTNSDKDLNSCLFDLDSNDNVLFSCYVTSSVLFSSDGSSIDFTGIINSGNVLIKFDSDGKKLWDVKINNIGPLNIPCLSLVTKKIFNTTFLQIACVPAEDQTIIYNDGKPSIVGSSIPIMLNSEGLILKIDANGNVKWVVSIKNSPILQSRLILDECTSNLLFSFSSDMTENFYLNGSISFVSSTNLIIFDATGKAIKYDAGYANPVLAVEDIFSVSKDPYYEPLYDGTFFSTTV
jgi:alpha-tubulin suppressor-like RCC1 family protein